MKILGILGIVLGEILSIYAENQGVKLYQDGSSVWPAFIKVLPYITIGGIFLVGGYIITAAVFKDVWMAALVSIIAILFVEPFVVYTFFHEIPSRGEFAGLSMAFLGLLAVIFL